jgi:hypothetical protein
VDRKLRTIEWAIGRDESGYSFLRDIAGLAPAERRPWRPTVARATAKAPAAAIAVIKRLSSTR